MRDFANLPPRRGEGDDRKHVITRPTEDAQSLQVSQV